MGGRAGEGRAGPAAPRSHSWAGRSSALPSGEGRQGRARPGWAGPGWGARWLSPPGRRGTGRPQRSGRRGSAGPAGGWRRPRLVPRRDVGRCPRPRLRGLRPGPRRQGRSRGGEGGLGFCCRGPEATGPAPESARGKRSFWLLPAAGELSSPGGRHRLSLC